MTDSFYSDFEGNAPEPVETPLANRKDLIEPYASPLAEKAQSAPTGDIKSNAEVSWWRYFTRQVDSSQIAQKVNGNFNRAKLTNYAKEKDEYIKAYNDELSRS